MIHNSGESADHDFNEDDQYFNMPKGLRLRLLNLCRSNEIAAIFTGHWHGTIMHQDQGLPVVTTGSCTVPLRDEPVSFQDVTVTGAVVSHVKVVIDPDEEHATQLRLRVHPPSTPATQPDTRLHPSC
jgi:hypothetical protein